MPSLELFPRIPTFPQAPQMQMAASASPAATRHPAFPPLGLEECLGGAFAWSSSGDNGR